MPATLFIDLLLLFIKDTAMKRQAITEVRTTIGIKAWEPPVTPPSPPTGPPIQPPMEPRERPVPPPPAPKPDTED